MISETLEKIDNQGATPNSTVPQPAELVIKPSKPATSLPVNEYGYVDIRHGLPSGLVHLTEPRVCMICKSVGVEYARACFAWNRWGAMPDGIVIRTEDQPKVMDALLKSKINAFKRKTAREELRIHERKRLARRIRDWFPSMPEDDVLRCAKRAMEIGSCRVGCSNSADDPVRYAVVAYARHRYTDHDYNFSDGIAREESQEAIAIELWDILDSWKTPTTVVDEPNSGDNGKTELCPSDACQLKAAA